MRSLCPVAEAVPLHACLAGYTCPIVRAVLCWEGVSQTNSGTGDSGAFKKACLCLSSLSCTALSMRVPPLRTTRHGGLWKVMGLDEVLLHCVCLPCLGAAVGFTLKLSACRRSVRAGG